MATPTEILNARLATGPRVSQDVLDVFDTTGGLTGEMYHRNVMDNFGSNVPQWLSKAEVSDEPAIPTLDVVFNKLGIKDTKDKKAYEHFVEDFPKKYNDYKSKLQKDPNWGEKGWKTVLDLWKQSIPQYEQEKARKEREKDTDIVDKMLLPRTTERYISGQPIQWKDALIDAVENVAMAVPGSGWMGALGKVRRAGEVLSKLPRASRLAGNAVVPVMSEVADDIAYDAGEGMDDRADFSVGDALLGTTVNQGADLGLQRLLTPSAQIMNELGGGAAQGVRDAVMQIGTTSRSRVKDAANANRQNIRNTASAVISGGDPTASGLKGLASGVSDETSKAPRGAVKQAKEYGKILDFIDEGKISPKSKEEINFVIRLGDRKSQIRSRIKTRRLEKQLEDATNPKVQAMLEEQIADEQLLRPNLAPTYKPSEIMNMSGLSNSDREMVDRAFKSNPQLYANLFTDAKVASDFVVPDEMSSRVWQGVKDVGTRNVAPYVQNKLGRTKWAATLGVPMQSLAESEHKDSREKGRKVAFSDVLKSAPSGSEDEAFIRAVRDNPEVLTYGLNSGDPAMDERFKIWLLKGGHQKISGLPGVRPLWEVR